MKNPGSLCRTIALALLLPIGGAHAGGLECAIRTALEGPKNARAFLFEHSFDVEPPDIVEKQKEGYTMTGRLVHRNSTGVAETVAYRVTRHKGAVKAISLRINDGKWQPISDPMFTALGDWRTGAPMPEEKQRAVERALERAVDKTWLRAAEFLIASVAIRHC
jgi:hypothetical protein